MIRPRHLTVALLALGLAVTAPSLRSQETGISFGGLKTDISQPVQVDADSLSIDQKDGSAAFTGNVVVTQGDMRLTAGLVTIRYGADQRSIAEMRAEGGVTLQAGSDVASADRAEYRPDTGELTLLDNVVLTQGEAAISGQKLVLNLETGLGQMSGRVTTIFTPGSN